MKRKVTKAPKIALCLACHGTGVASHEQAGPARGQLSIARLFGRKAATEAAPGACPQCGGSGRVTVSAKMELDIRPYTPPETRPGDEEEQ